MGLRRSSAMSNGGGLSPSSAKVNPKAAAAGRAMLQRPSSGSAVTSPFTASSATSSLSRSVRNSASQPVLKSCLSSGSFKRSSNGSLPRGRSAHALTEEMRNQEFNITRNVSFSKVEFREYEQTLGDNPGVSSGVPVSLGWNYDPNKKVADVEKFEALKTSRSKEELRMGAGYRADLLQNDYGVSDRELLAAAQEVASIKNDRIATMNRPVILDKGDEIMEKFAKKLTKLKCSEGEEAATGLWDSVES